jgi:CRP/FNR family transcriptional regulator
MRSIKIDSEHKIAALCANRYLNSLRESAIIKLAESTTLREYDRGENLFWEGDPCAGLVIIHSGSVKLFRVSPQGRQYIIRVLTEGETCNEVPVFDGGMNPVNVEALETTQVWVVDSNAIRELFRTEPGFAESIIKNLGQNLRNLVRMVSEMAFMQVTHRLARLITELPEDDLAGETGSRLTQDQIAARLGTVREVVARSLKELEKSGAIHVENRKITIADAEALSLWAQGPWS